MTKWTSAKKYNDRDVRVECFPLEGFQLNSNSLQNAVVFVNLNEVPSSEEKLRHLREEFLKATPLTLVFFGLGSEDIAEYFIQYLNEHEQEQFGLVFQSGENVIEEAIYDFFCSYYPPHERWDSWTEHLFITIGSSDCETMISLVDENVPKDISGDPSA